MSSTVSIRREHVTWALKNASDQESCLELHSPHHWGKTWLLTKEFLPLIEKCGSKAVYLDLYPIRRTKYASQDREASRWLFENNESEYIKFLSAYEFDQTITEKKTSVLQYLLSKDERFSDAKYVVIDHIETLENNSAINSWIESLVEFLLHSEKKVILSNAAGKDTVSFLKKKRNSSNWPIFTIPKLTIADIQSLLETQNNKVITDVTSIGKLIYDATGGLVALIRDFLIFIENFTTIDEEAVDRFISHSANSFLASTQYIFSSFIEYPEEIDSWNTTDNNELVDKLFLSGAVIIHSDKTLSPAAKLYDVRLSDILTTNNLSKSYSTKSITSSDIKNTRKLPQELISIQANNYLHSISNHSDAFYFLHVFIRDYFRCNITVFIRDESHPVVWHQLAIKSHEIHEAKEIVLKGDNPTNRIFRDLIHTGRRIRSENGDIYFPIVSSEGGVRFIICAKVPMRRFMHNWYMLKFERALSHFIRCVSPSIGHHINSYYLRTAFTEEARQIRQMEKKGVIEEGGITKSFLDEADAQAIATLHSVEKANGIHIWAPKSFYYDNYFEKSSNIDRSMFIDKTDGALFSSLAGGYTHKGMILGDKELRHIIPGCLSTAYIHTAYIKPVKVQKQLGGIETVLVFFLFADHDSYRVLVGKDQRDLNYFAHRLVHLDKMKEKLSLEYQQELDNMDVVGMSMQELITSPSGANIKLIEFLRRAFSVTSISINEVVTKNEHKVVKMIFGAGYSKKYRNHEYVISGELSNGKTGYVAESGRTLLSSARQGTNKTEDYYYDEISGNFLRLECNIKNKNQCDGHLDKQSHMRTFLATPIGWRRSGFPQEIIGVLKMSNRTIDKEQTFTPQEVALARRIARMITPVLYLRQQREQFEISRQRGFLALIGGIEHEVKHHLKDIRWPLGMLEDYLQGDEAEYWKQRMEDGMDGVNHCLSGLRGIINKDGGIPEVISIKSIIEESINTFDKQIDNNIYFENLVASNDLYVYIDKSQLLIAFDNLIRNAMEALDNCDDGKITISAQSTSQIGSIQVSIADNGPGIPEESIGEIFAPFRSGKNPHHSDRVVSAENPGKIRGIGLALVKAIIEMSGGEISVTSSESGTTFTFSLPPAEWCPNEFTDKGINSNN